MLRVPIAEARPGMTLTAVVAHPRNPGTPLLRPGVVLDEHAIERLREIECEEVWIEYPGLEFVREHVCPEVFAARTRIAQQVAGAFRAVVRGSHARLDWPAYRDAIASLMARLTSSRSAQTFVQQASRHDQPMLAHAVNACHLSLLMGLRLDFYLVQERSRVPATIAKNAVNLGLGAMLKDIGMMDLDQEALDRWYATQDDSDPEFQSHVVRGFERVRGSVDPSAAAVVLHHHQKFDGSGFPPVRSIESMTRNLVGREIHVFARIAACADLFDRLRYPPRAEGRIAQMSTCRALSLMRRPPHSNWIDPTVFRALVQCVPVFAPGTMVVLNDARRGVVVAWTPEFPCQPTVEILGSSLMGVDESERERIDLREAPGLSVAWAEGFDVTQDLFYPASPHEFTLAGEGTWVGQG